MLAALPVDCVTTCFVSEDREDYLVFSVNDKNTFYAYSPFEKAMKGTYQKTANPNIYKVELKDALNGHVFLGKESLTCVEDKKVTNYAKISPAEIFYEPNEEYLTK